MIRPLVSIVVPTYNQRDFIVRAVESALDQSYEPLEVVVADDCSQDDTEVILKRRFSDNPKFRYFKNDFNKGRVANYRYALHNYARGQWVVNLDGDDYYCDRDFISLSIEMISRSTSPIVFLQAGQYIEMEGRMIVDNPCIKTSSLQMDGKLYFLRYAEWKHFSHLATLFDRELAKSIDFYRLDIASADIESFLRLAMHGHVILLKRPVGVWVHHGSNYSQHLTWRSVFKNFDSVRRPFLYSGGFQIGLFKRWWWFFEQVFRYFLTSFKQKVVKQTLLRVAPSAYRYWLTIK